MDDKSIHAPTFSSQDFQRAIAGPNPFTVAAGSRFDAFVAPASSAPDREGTYEYQVVPTGPEVPGHEVEEEAQAVTVRVLWGRNVLHVETLPPGRSFYIGEDSDAAPVDYAIPEKTLGVPRAPLVVADDGTPHVVIMPAASGTIETAEQPSIRIATAIEQGLLGTNAEVTGGHTLALRMGTSVRMAVGDLVFEVDAVKKGKKMGGVFSLAALMAGSALLHILGAAVFVVGFLSATAYFTPPLADTASGDLTDDQRYLIKQYLAASAELELAEQETEALHPPDADATDGGQGTAAHGESGTMGDAVSRAQNLRNGIRGPADNPDPRIARQNAIRDAAEFGMIGLINSGGGGDPDTVTAAWGADDSLGADPLNARGNMWGDAIGNASGVGGLSLTGIGEGGGGRGEGIGLDRINTIGRCAGTCLDQGFGHGTGRLPGTHRAQPPKIRQSSTEVSGRLPAQVIQRIVRQNFGRFRLCYESALRRDPNLQGRVMVRFLIGRDGTVSSASAGGMPGVASCVGQAIYGLSFPPPEGGIVTVSYPIVFTPSSGE
ncbi:MAG: AgmX/PglI C-terminal domain-containing protein [Myxococcota bacterium]